jgi:RNA polymerase sigma-70 factor (ECF subfamily)
VLDSLVARAQDGDEEAFVSLVQAVGDRCLAIAYRILRDLPMAEDAVQNACTVAWRELPMLRDRDRFEPWLHRILVRTCYAEAKRRRRDAAAALLASAQPSHQPDTLRAVEDRDQLERGFRRLPPEQRAVLVFHHYLQLPMTEVAVRLGIPVGTAKSRLRYATTGLRAALDADARPPAAAKERPA